MSAPEIPSSLVAVQAMLLVQPGLGTCDFDADAGGLAIGRQFEARFSLVMQRFHQC